MLTHTDLFGLRVGERLRPARRRNNFHKKRTREANRYICTVGPMRRIARLLGAYEF
jgi:hypothetical protein